VNSKDTTSWATVGLALRSGWAGEFPRSRGNNAMELEGARRYDDDDDGDVSCSIRLTQLRAISSSAAAQTDRQQHGTTALCQPLVTHASRSLGRRYIRMHRPAARIWAL